MLKIADLHTHTSFSDGSFTPEELIKQARIKGISCISITDHDNIDSLPRAFGIAEKNGIELIPGVEMTAQEIKKELHILGYFIRWDDNKLRNILDQTCESRSQRVHIMADKLKKHGVNVSADSIIEYAKTKAVSRMHIAQYLYENNFVASVKSAFDKYIGDTGPCCVSRFRFSSKEVIESIKRSGGIAVIAHPGLNNVFDILPALVENGIEGIEVFHSEHSYSMTNKLKEFAEKNNLLITGGSDCHGLNKKRVLIGNIKLPYKYVEILKEYVKKRTVQQFNDENGHTTGQKKDISNLS